MQGFCDLRCNSKKVLLSLISAANLEKMFSSSFAARMCFCPVWSLCSMNSLKSYENIFLFNFFDMPSMIFSGHFCPRSKLSMTSNFLFFPLSFSFLTSSFFCLIAANDTNKGSSLFCASLKFFSISMRKLFGIYTVFLRVQ